MRTARAAALATALFVLAANPASAAPGGLDPSFGKGGWVRADYGMLDLGAGVVRTGDGRTVVAGTAFDSRGGSTAYVARYLADGRPDPAFGSRGVARTTFGGAGIATGLEQLPDGRLLVVGGVSGGRNGLALARYLPNGRPDPSFGTGGTAVAQLGPGLPMPTDAAVATDGSVVVVGAQVHGRTEAPFVVRLLPDGRRDTAFVPSTVVPTAAAPATSPAAVELLPDGSAVVVGTVRTGDATQVPYLTRYLPNGLQDPTFGTAAITSMPGTELVALTRTASGFWVAAGHRPENGADGGFPVGVLVRFLPTGTLDATFGTAGALTVEGTFYTRLNAVAALPDGRVVAGGSTAFDAMLVRLDALGRLDTSFGKGGVSAPRTFQVEEVADLAVGADGTVTTTGTVADRLKMDTFTARFLG